VVKPYGTAGITNPGPHGLSQILYAYVSSTGNNGSAFGGINANTLWYNTTTGVAQLLGRFFMIIPIMAIAGSLAKKKTVPESAGTFPVTGALFTTLLVSTILIVGALTFFPALSLGPILEHLLMMAGKASLRISEESMEQTGQKKINLLGDRKIVSRAVLDSFAKLHPRTMVKNPVMFVVEVGAVLTSIELVKDTMQHAGQFGFGLQITLWLWFTVLFANFAEAMAEGRGKAQADTLRKSRAETVAHRLRADGSLDAVPSSQLRSGDIVVVAAGEFIPGDGEVIEGVPAREGSGSS